MQLCTCATCLQQVAFQMYCSACLYRFSHRYVLAFKPDNYVFIYYRGQNDAWLGYGGATVYTR